jgi:hypothetical protein
MLARSLLPALAAALLLRAGAAQADEPQDDASRAAAAQSLFEEAVTLMRAGKFGEACPKLASSEKLDPGAGTLLNLGTCYEKNGQSASAWATFIEAEAVATRAGHADWAQRARDHSEKLAPHLPRLTIVVPKDVAASGFTVTRDGVALDEGTWGTPMPLDPGPHELNASAAHKKPWSQHVDLKADEPTVTVTVPALEDIPLPPPPAVEQPPALPHEGPPAPPPPPGFWTTERLVGAGISGVGVAGLAVGVAFVAVAVSQYNDASSHCTGGACTVNSYVNEGASAHHLADAATGVLIGGGVVTLAGGAIVLFGGPSTHSSGWQLTPSLGPNVAGASLAGAW